MFGQRNGSQALEGQTLALDQHGQDKGQDGVVVRLQGVGQGVERLFADAGIGNRTAAQHDPDVPEHDFFSHSEPF